MARNPHRRKFLGNGIPNRKPSALKRAKALMISAEFEVQARREREQFQSYRGSETEREFRAGTSWPKKRGR
jgi:hypothetical protein